MRNLVLLRGAPGCGKSTFLQRIGLKQFALVPDELRLMVQAPVLHPNGLMGISQRNEKLVWDYLFQLLELRMQRGEFTVIDATHSKSTDFAAYKKLCEQYRYRIFCIDMSNVPLNTCLAQNAQREEYKHVPSDKIELIYERFATQVIPNFVKVLKTDKYEPDTFFSDLEKIVHDNLKYIKHDYSDYEKIVVIGDIHGCHTVLKEYLDGFDLNDEKILYIFVGDYIDRGIENAEVVKLLLSLVYKPNFIFLEGNHERWLWEWANDNEKGIKSNEFNFNTRVELELKNVDKKEVRQFYRRLTQISYFKFHEKTFLITHGGLSKIPDNLLYISNDELIKGSGKYQDMLLTNETFLTNTPENTFQIHGHRNIEMLPVQINDKCFNLENKVEFGGNLRAIEITKDAIDTVEIQNMVFKAIIPKPEIVEQYSTNDIEIMLARLEHSRSVIKKSFGNISSYNFTRSAFHKKIWNDITTKARGLFINTDTKKIVARSYDKFFNINEREETKIDNLPKELVFPVKAYLKENGFLGMFAYNEETDNLIYATKSSLHGPYNKLFENAAIQNMTSDNLEKLKEYLKTNNVTLVVEVIDPIYDPHIIHYNATKIVGLEVIKNDLTDTRLAYEELVKLCIELGIDVKKHEKTFNTWGEFYTWYQQIESESYSLGEPIEGYVIEDKEGKLIKVKTFYYRFWKEMRTLATKYKKNRNNPVDLSKLYNKTSNRFYAWLKTIPENFLEEDIIYLRNKFFHEILLDDIKMSNEAILIK